MFYLLISGCDQLDNFHQIDISSAYALVSSPKDVNEVEIIKVSDNVDEVYDGFINYKCVVMMWFFSIEGLLCDLYNICKANSQKNCFHC